MSHHDILLVYIPVDVFVHICILAYVSRRYFSIMLSRWNKIWTIEKRQKFKYATITLLSLLCCTLCRRSFMFATDFRIFWEIFRTEVYMYQMLCLHGCVYLPDATFSLVLFCRFVPAWIYLQVYFYQLFDLWIYLNMYFVAGDIFEVHPAFHTRWLSEVLPLLPLKNRLKSPGSIKTEKCLPGSH